MNIGIGGEICNMKMLYILNIAKRVNNFSYTSMLAAQECGFDFHIAGNWSYANHNELLDDEKKYGIKIHQIDFVRKPYSFKNYKAYKQLLELCEKEKFDVIHCNTPIGGLLGRLVGSKCKVKTIIYQAHGFHFYKGAPLLNWLFYYPIEKWLAHRTDILITINKEDYEFAKRKMRLRKNGEIEYVPGVGIDISLYKNEKVTRIKKRDDLGIKMNDIVVISTGDLIDRKNYTVSIEAIAKTNNYNIQYFVCGVGPREGQLKELARKFKIESQVHFLGYRNDVRELLNASDMFLLSSKQEGLSRSLMEAMASGLPCIASNIRGNIDLLGESNGGFLCDKDNPVEFAEKINLLSNDAFLREKMGCCNLKYIAGLSTESVKNDMKSQYFKINRGDANITS